MFGKSKRKVGDIIEPPLDDIEPLLNEERFAKREIIARPSLALDSSSISSGLSIVGKIVGQGKLAIFGHVEGEIHASTVQIGDGAEVEGDIVAQDLTIGG